MYFLLRHAEKKSGSNPRLTETGRARARSLARMFGENSNISIFGTNYQRVIETANPLSELIGEPMKTYDRNNLHQLKARLSLVDGPKIVIGHSKSTVELFAILSGSNTDPILEDTEFDRLYILSDGAFSTSDFVQIRYG